MIAVNSARMTLIASRVLIGVVLALNVQCAVLFIATPAIFAPGFELTGVAGESMVRGMGILFLMWNVPYLIAFTNPLTRWWSLIEATAMQAIGLAGESLMLIALPVGHEALRMTGQRFILFDGGGLVLLGLALYLTGRLKTGGIDVPAGESARSNSG